MNFILQSFCCDLCLAATATCLLWNVGSLNLAVSRRAGLEHVVVALATSICELRFEDIKDDVHGQLLELIDIALQVQSLKLAVDSRLEC